MRGSHRGQPHRRCLQCLPGEISELRLVCAAVVRHATLENSAPKLLDAHRIDDLLHRCRSIDALSRSLTSIGRVY